MAEAVHLIGLCISTPHREDRFHFIQALNQSAVARGFRLVIFNSCSDLYEQSNPNNKGERSVFRMIPYEMLSAMVVMPRFLCNDPIIDQVAEQCIAHGLPVISIDREMKGCISFSFSYADIFERLCAHIVDDHHAKTLLMMAGVKDNEFSNQRIAAFRKVLEDRNMYFDDSLIGYGNFWDIPAVDVMREWFEEEGRPYPDAIICANDSMAIAVSSYLQKHGCRVPEDCIVTGFDSIRQSSFHMPHLTTCRQDYDTMGERILDAVEARMRGEDYPTSNTVGFTLIRSQSCGCEPISFTNINDATQEIFDRMRLSEQRQEMMCTVQSAVSKMKSIEELPAVLADRFIFPTTIIAANDDIFEPPHYGTKHGEQLFTEQVRVHYQRYFWYQIEPCTIPRAQLVPRMDILLGRSEPIVVCALHYLDLPLGYCVFQPEHTLDDYEKIYTFMIAINASFGGFHGQMQIKSINQQLQNVNAELERLHIHDYLTELYNRRGFYREFHRLLAQNSGEGMHAFLISADLDRLKMINDTYGHQEGDSAICVIAEALRQAAGEHDICARFGGDEFAVGGFLPAPLADVYCERFRRQFTAYLETYNQVSGKPYPVEASIGFGHEPAAEGFDLDRMIKEADDRMYQNKLAHKKARES